MHLQLIGSKREYARKPAIKVQLCPRQPIVSKRGLALRGGYGR